MPDAKVLLLEAGPRDTDPLHPHAGWLLQDDRRPAHLGLSDGAACAMPTIAWPSIRRRACSAAAVRSMRKSIRAAAPKITTAGLAELAARAGAGRTSSHISSSRKAIPARRQRARRRRTARRLRSRQSQPRFACLCPGLHGLRHAAQCGFQFGQAGRRWPLSDDDPRAAALQRRGRPISRPAMKRPNLTVRTGRLRHPPSRSRKAAPMASKSSKAGR